MNDEIKIELFNEKLKILKHEMEMIQKSIDKFDDLIFKIRSFSATICIALLGYAINERIFALTFLSFITATFFWLDEALLKSFQRGYILRMNKIVKYLQSEEFNTAFLTKDFQQFPIPDPSNHYLGTIKEKRKVKFINSLFLPNVCMYYYFLMILSLILYYLN